MKKYFLYGLGAAMGLALTACDGYKEPNPPAQYNPQETILKVSDVKVESKLTSEVYDLTTMAADKQNIEMAQIECSVLPAGYTFGTMAYISADGFENSTPVASEVMPLGIPDVWKVEIEPEALQTAYNDGISTDVEQTKLEIRFLVTTVLEDQTAIVGGLENFYGPYSLTIMPGEPAQIEMPGPFLWTPGDSNGWNQDASMKLFTTDDGITFVGFALLSDNGFKFTDQNDWNGTNYGAGEEEGTLSTDGEAGNLTAPASGLYWCKVNVEELTYELTPISSIGIIGDCTPGGWDTSTPLATTNNIVWSGDALLTSGQFKFRCNDDWAVNLGGNAFNYLMPDGANLDCPGEGEYTITLDISRLPYSCTLVKH